MKRFFALLALAALTLALVGCGEKKDEGSAADAADSVETMATDAATEATDAVDSMATDSM